MIEKIIDLDFFPNKYFRYASILAATCYAYFSSNKTNTNKILKNLDIKEAILRSNHIIEVKYNLFLNFCCDKVNGMKTFRGSLEIELNVNETQGLFLDYVGKVNCIEVNEKIVRTNHSDGRLYFSNLKKGRNKIIVNFESNYSESLDHIFRKYNDEIKGIKYNKSKESNFGNPLAMNVIIKNIKY